MEELEEEDEEEEMEEYQQEEEKSVIKFLNKVGNVYQDDNIFNHYKEIGENQIYYKPEKIIVWTGEKDDQIIISGVDILYRNILNGKKMKCKENIGTNMLDKHEIIIKPTEYLIKLRVWKDDYIYKLNFMTNKGNVYEVGTNNGEEIILEELNGSNIILLFNGNYKEYLNSIGLYYISMKNYMEILFLGYFELRALLKKKEKKEEILKKIDDKKFKFDELALVQTCLLPSNHFNAIIKYCIV